MKTHGLLPKDYFLDKNFYPLRDYLVESLRWKDYGEDTENGMKRIIKLDDFKDIITDVLLELKPTFEQVKTMDLTEKYDVALSFVFGVEEVDKIAEAKNEEDLREVLIHLINKKK